MSLHAIEVVDLGKRYRLGTGTERYSTLRDTIAGLARTHLRRFSFGRPETPEPEDSILWALKDITFSVEPGEVVGVVGRNGAGKSTLLKILSRITDPTEGWAEIRGRVGSLLEVGTGFHNELTGAENIYLNGAILGMSKAEIDSQFGKIVEFAEVRRFINTQVKHYSSGMYLRLAFAVAAHLQPEILIVDEVLAVGDAAFQAKCLGKMEEAAASGRTVLFVSHNLNAIVTLCSRVVWIDAGRLIEDGSPQVVTRSYLASISSPIMHVVSQDAQFEIHGVDLKNGSGHSIRSFGSGESMAVEISYFASKPLHRPHFWVKVESLRGPCFVANMLLDGSSPDAITGSGVIVCRFDLLPLLPQEYRVLIGVRSATNEVVIAEQQGASFNVVGDLKRFGFKGDYFRHSARSPAVVVPYEWVLPDGSRRRVAIGQQSERSALT